MPGLLRFLVDHLLRPTSGGVWLPLALPATVGNLFPPVGSQSFSLFFQAVIHGGIGRELIPPFSSSRAHQPMPTWPSWQWWRSWSWRCRRQAPRRPPRRRQCLSQGCTGGCPLTFAETCLRKRPAHVGGATCAGSAARAGDGPSRVMGADDRTRVTTTASGIQFYAARAWRRGATSTCGSC